MKKREKNYLNSNQGKGATNITACLKEKEGEKLPKQQLRKRGHLGTKAPSPE